MEQKIPFSKKSDRTTGHLYAKQREKKINKSRHTLYHSPKVIQNEP